MGLACVCVDRCIGACGVAIVPAIEIGCKLPIGSVLVFSGVPIGFVCDVDTEIYTNNFTADRDTLLGGDDGNRERGYFEC